MIFPSPIFRNPYVGGVPLAEWSLSETCHESSYSAPGPMPTLHAPVLLQPNSCVCICMHIYNIYIYILYVCIYIWYIHIADNICIQYMSSGHNYVLNLMPCTNLGRPLSVVGIQYSRRYHKWGIGIGSSPIGHEGFVQPQKGRGEARLNWYYNNFVRYSYIYIYIRIFRYNMIQFLPYCHI